MKIFLILLLSFMHLLSADIDKKLYESEDLLTHYKGILQEREKNEPNEHTQFELKLLHKLIDLQEKPLKPYALDLSNLKNTETSYFDLIFEYATLIKKFNADKQRKEQLYKSTELIKGQIQDLPETQKEKLLSLQLQHAFYKISHKLLEKNIQNFKQTQDDIFLKLLEFKGKVDFDIAFAQNSLQELERKINEIKVKQRLKMIDLDTFTIDGNEVSAEKTKKELESLQKSIDEVEVKKFRFIMVELLDALKNKNNNVFEKYKLLEKIKLENNINEEVSSLLKQMITKEMGTTKTVISTTKESFLDLLQNLWDIINKPLLVYQEKEISLLSFIKVGLILFIGLFIAWFYKNKLIKSENIFQNLSISNRTIIGNLGYYFIFVITLFTALESVGLDLSSFAMIAGALSVGIGFGLQNIVSNFISGIILMFEKSIRIGDIIEIDATLQGTISKINMRSTILTTYDNIDVIIPNSAFIENNVINYTYGDLTRRLHIPFGVAYGTETQTVKDVVLEALDKSPIKYIRNLKDKKPDIWMKQMGASSVDYELLVWIDATLDPKDRPRQKDFLELIYNVLNQHQIQIPFPQLDVHLHSMKKS